MDKGAKSGLTLNNAEWNVHLAAESWKEDNKLNWVNIVSDNNKGSLLVLDEGGDVLKTILDGVWSSLWSSLTLSDGSKTSSLGSLVLWLVVNE